MAVRLLFLGRLRDLAGGDERNLAANPGETVATLLDRLEPDLAAELRSPRVRVAVNGAVLGDIAAARVAAGDEIAFLPPVSGGWVAAEVRLAEALLDPGAEIARFAAAHPQSGGLASFIGQVRAESGEGAVLELELSHYPPLTLPGMRALADTALGRWPLDGLLVVHRVGAMRPGEPIVLVAAVARHRRDAFVAVDFVMDHLKSEAWFWKRERTAAGWQWIEPRAQDHADTARW